MTFLLLYAFGSGLFWMGSSSDDSISNMDVGICARVPVDTVFLAGDLSLDLVESHSVKSSWFSWLETSGSSEVWLKGLSPRDDTKDSTAEGRNAV